MPSSQVERPGMLWPPQRTAIGRSSLAAEADGGHDVVHAAWTDDDRGSAVDHPVPDAARLVVPESSGRTISPPNVSRKELRPCTRASLVDGRCGSVLLVGHVVAPRGRYALVVDLDHRQVGHEPVRRGTVPVLLARLEEDAPNRFMTHLAMVEVDDEGIPATWGDHVSDEEYGAAPPID